MVECKSCGTLSTASHCLICGSQVMELRAEDLPPIEWKYIRDHVLSHLMIDTEWMLEEDDGIIWWPWFLPQSIYVSGRTDVVFDGVTEVGIRVTVETIIGTATDRADALDAAANLMSDFPFGSIVVLDDDRFALLSSVFLHSRNRGLLNLLHEEALVQASFAHDAALMLESKGIITIPAANHPSSGRRETPDELIVSVYGSDRFHTLIDLNHIFEMRELVRTTWKRAAIRSGAEQGFENEQVTFVTFSDGFDSAVGWRDDEFASVKFGPSLMIWNNLATTRYPLSAEAMNALNLDLALDVDFGLGHLGGITQGISRQGDLEFNTVRHVAQLPAYFVGSQGTTPEGMAQNITNAIYQASAGARFAHWQLHSSNNEGDVSH